MLATILTEKLYFVIPGHEKDVKIKTDLVKHNDGLYVATCEYTHNEDRILRITNIGVYKNEGKEHVDDIVETIFLEKGDTLSFNYSIHVEEI